MRGMLIGRFQPFHKGHLNTIKHILNEMDDLLIIIAASQQSYLVDNPYTAGERYEMIANSLKEEIKEIYKKVIIIPANDIRDSDLWVAHILRLSPKFDVVYTNNPHTKLLFEQAKIEVRSPPYFERKECSGSYIRNLMIKNENKWKDLVPKAVIKKIEEINGVNRLKIISSSDVV